VEFGRIELRLDPFEPGPFMPRVFARVVSKFGRSAAQGRLIAYDLMARVIARCVLSLGFVSIPFGFIPPSKIIPFGCIFCIRNQFKGP
jgi:hypothetical protein